MQEPSVLGLLRGSKTQTRRLAKRKAPLHEVGETLYVKEAWAARADVDPGLDLDKAKHYLLHRVGGSDNIESAWHDYTPGWRSPLFMPEWAARLRVTITDVRRQNLLDITDADAEAEGLDEYHGLLEDTDICAMAKAIGGMATDSRIWYLTAWDDLHKADRTRVPLKVFDKGYKHHRPWTTVADKSTLAAANPMVDAYTFTVEKV